MKRLLLPVVSGILLATQANAFVVKNISLEGLQRVSSGTVYNSFPINIGDDIDSSQLANAAKSLFKTGYFEDIHLARNGNTLVVRLAERPTINDIKITGNKAISTDNLKKGLKQAGLSDGDIYKPATLKEIQQELEQQYVSQGKYSAYVNAKVTPLPRNRINIELTINEGKNASIRGINIVGIHAFNQEDLLDLFQLKSRHWSSWIKGDDKYSREKLAGDLERLKSYYMDRGYINFKVDSTQVSVTPDKSQVYITVNINEGARFKVGKIKLSGNLVYSEPEIQKLISIKTGETFSLQKVTKISDEISNKLGDKGYIFANINPIPEINQKKHTVNLTFFVTPGRKVYVRYINFIGNTRTRDEVLRREMRQFEGALASNVKIKDSTDHLNRLGFFKNVNSRSVPVQGSDNQVDLNYDVEEQSSGSLVASIGFSQVDGLLLGGSINQQNFLGTGNSVNLSAQTSKYTKNYQFSYNNPFYTVDGVSRGFNLYYNTTNYNKIDVTNYNLDRLGGDIQFGYPVSDISRLSLALGAEQTSVKEGNTPAYFIQDFLNKHGKSYNTFTSTLGWSQSKLNYGLLPTAGYAQSASLQVAVPGSSQTFYKLNYTGQYLHQLSDNFSLRFHGHLGYGDGLNSKALPFYENFFGGGTGSVRGFEYGTFGPQALQTDGKRDPIGGNAVADGGVSLLFPLPFLKDKRSAQASLFMDMGNVWSTHCSDRTVSATDPHNAGQAYSTNCHRPDLSSLRYSAGIGLTWITPLGPLTFSLAEPLKKGKTDSSQVFQFSLGTTF